MEYTPEMVKRFISIFKKTGCNISASCDGVGISRQTYYDWRKYHPDFDLAIKDELERDKDNLESVIKQVAYVDKNPTMLIFLSKVKMADRGYVEKQQIKLEHDIIIGLPADMILPPPDDEE